MNRFNRSSFFKKGYWNEEGIRIVEGTINDKPYKCCFSKDGLLMDELNNLTSQELKELQEECDKSVRESERAYGG